MAESTSYPVLSGANWWKLRNKFKAAFPKSPVTEEYLASVLNMQKKSVKNNGILNNLKLLGLLDQDNKCTDLANRWRLDESYVAACDEIRMQVYPPELIDIGTERVAVASWFMNKSGVGKSLADKLVSLYLLLSNPELSEPKSLSTPKQNSKPQKPQNVEKKEATESLKGDNKDSISAPSSAAIPSMNINLQIHISADATPEQIDLIFSSMAKHLYGRE